MNSSVTKYQTQQVMTASPARLVCMLYDRTILSLREVIAAIEAGDIERRWRSNKRAMDIIAHMWSTLDTGRGGEIANNLSDLFNYMLSRLPTVDLKNDGAAAREVIGLLEPLRDAWHAVAASDGNAAPVRTPAAAGAPATPQPTSLSA